jgi:hypothetical protein
MDCRVAQAEAVKCMMDFCANHPKPLDSSLPVTTPPPPLALSMEHAERLASALCMCAQASIMRRLESMTEASANGADAEGPCTPLVTAHIPDRSCISVRGR